MLIPFQAKNKSVYACVSCMVIGAALCFISPRTAKADDAQRNFERELIREINTIRADPQSYIPRLQKTKQLFHGNTIVLEGNIRIKTREGKKVIEEAIEYLKKVKPVHTLQSSDCLSLSAKDHCNDQKITGIKGHRGSNGTTPSQRITQRCGRKKKTGESIAYGMYTGNTPESVVIQLIVDDGVKDRIHRIKLFDAGFQFIGTACGQHPDPKLRFMCVINTAGD